MYEIQILDYNGVPVRMTLINGERWYSLSDVCEKVLKYTQYSNVYKKLDDTEKKKISVPNPKSFGGVKLNFISEQGLLKFLELSGRPEGDNFKNWLVDKFDLDLSKVDSKLSIQASLQKAQLLIRIAENKAVPYNEQIRLLDLATKELTGTGLNFKLSDVISIKPPVNIDIMDLPEVVGFIHDKETRKVDGKLTDFLPAELMVKKWLENCNDKTFDAKAFSELADDNGYKADKFGFWKKVTTPNGEAREFMYFDGTMLDYMNKKFGRVA